MDYKAFYEAEQKRADKAEDELATCKAQLAEEKDTARYSWDRMLETASRAIKAELENERLREFHSRLGGALPCTPRECIVCGSADVVSMWLTVTNTRGPGIGRQKSLLWVWYCEKHKPQGDDHNGVA